MTTINDILSMSQVCASSGRVQPLQAGAPVGFSDLQWRQGLGKAVTEGFLLHTSHQGEDRYFLAEPFTTINGDVYRLTLGSSDNAGNIMVHGFSTKGFSLAKNGLVPRQVSQWVNASDIRHPRVADTPEQAIRDRYNALPSVRMNVWQPLSVPFNGNDVEFLVCQKQRMVNGNGCLYLARLEWSRLITGMDVTLNVKYYKLDRKNELAECGYPSQATDGDIQTWKEVGFDLPTRPADSDTRKAA